MARAGLLSVGLILLGTACGVAANAWQAADSNVPARTLSPPVVEAFGSCFVNVARHNTTTALIVFWGALGLGVASIIQLFGVGLSFGHAIHFGLASHAPPLFIAAAILPHGLIEIAGFCLSFVAASLLIRIFVELWVWQPHDARRSARLLAAVALGAMLMLTTGAGVECRLTPALLHFVYSAHARP